MTRNVSPGEKFAVKIALVGSEYGTTTGVIYNNVAILNPKILQ